MKKFLQVSGVIFWIQCFLIICFFVLVKVNSTRYYAELDNFNRALQADIFDQRKWESTHVYFAENLVQKINDSFIVKSLGSAGPLKNCQFESFITSSIDQTIADVVSQCQYEENSYTIDFIALRNDGSWLITGVTVTSDAFDIRL